MQSFATTLSRGLGTVKRPALCVGGNARDNRLMRVGPVRDYDMGAMSVTSFKAFSAFVPCRTGIVKLSIPR
jgi:hypothetical protein